MRNQFDNLRPPQHARAAARVLVGASHGPEQCAAAVQVLEGAVQGFEGELGSPREKAGVGQLLRHARGKVRRDGNGEAFH